MHVVDNPGELRPTRRIMPDLRRLAPPKTPSAIASISQAEAPYPARLRVLSHPPDVLWVRGGLPAEGRRTVALVGARAATGAGCARARALASQLARRGFLIVSGGAFGIDAAAHEGALDAQAPTYAVLGCGVDVVYPDRHGPLFSRIIAQGGLLSEYELGTPPRAGQFPARNRIIAALADAVIVVEAAYRSGALITAALARSLGRPVLALAGSPGTNSLLHRNLANAIADSDDIEAVLAGRPIAQSETAPVLAGNAAALYAFLREGASTPGLLSRRAGLPLPTVMAVLAEAELDGWLSRGPGNLFEVIRRGCQ
jgi:DNA processing protein